MKTYFIVCPLNGRLVTMRRDVDDRVHDYRDVLAEEVMHLLHNDATIIDAETGEYIDTKRQSWQPPKVSSASRRHALVAYGIEKMAIEPEDDGTDEPGPEVDFGEKVECEHDWLPAWTRHWHSRDHTFHDREFQRCTKCGAEKDHKDGPRNPEKGYGSYS